MQDEPKVNILLVDDEPANLLALEATLESLGQNLTRAHSGEDALRCVLKQDYAVILLDVRMPTMDGFETASLIRARNKSRQTPIIFLTGMNADIEHVFRGYEVGAVDYIVKPINPEILKSKVSVFVELYHKTQEIKRQEKKYREIFESFSDIYFRMDLQGRLLLASPSILTKLGYEPQEVIGRYILMLYSDPAMAEPMMQLLKGSGVVRDYELALHAKDGRIVDFSINANLVFADDGQPVAIEGILHDITDRKEVERLRVEESLREQSRILQSILDSMGDGVVVADAQGEFLLCNPAAEQITGYSPIGIKPAEWAARYGAFLPDMATPYPQDELPLVRAMRGEVIDGAEVYVHSPKRPKGTWLSVNGRPLKGNDGRLRGGIAVFRDITERKHSEQRLTYLAQYDPLTGLPNRNLFRDRLAQAVNRTTRTKELVALMFLDLDNFKNINDTLGHIAGDLLLKAVAQRLSHCVRQTDTVARLGGDEFTIILVGRTKLEHITVIAQKILETMIPHFNIAGQEVFITTSVGIATYASSDPQDIDNVIKNADMALYRAKDLGRNNYQLYTPQMHDKTNKRLAVEGNLRRALERNELLIYYQPQIDMHSGKIIGAEALLRWQPSGSDMLLPAHFIDLAEETGLIVAIGEWVLESVCAQNKSWQDAGLSPIRIAVNCSARQLRQPEFIGFIRRVLTDTGLEAQYLDLEITEAHLMENIQASSGMIGELKAMGIYISIDDFGTGYSSLSYLKQFPLDILKIDQSFVSNIPADPHDTAIAATIITLAHSLQFKVIAEGVETEDQLTFLREKGCNYIQGYLFSEPLTAEEFAKLLHEEREFLLGKKTRTQKNYGDQRASG